MAPWMADKVQSLLKAARFKVMSEAAFKMGVFTVETN